MIDLDEPRLRRAIGDILDTAPDVPSAPLGVSASPVRRRWHLDLAAAAAVVAIGVAGVVVVTRDDDRSTTHVAPTTSPATTFEIPANGRLVFDPVPEGLHAAWAQRDGSSSPADTQVYVENRTRPELGAAVFVSAIEIRPPRDDGEDVIVQSAPGTVYTEMNGEHVTFGPVDGVTFALDGYGMTRDELLDVAEGALLGEHGTVAIDPAFLLPGMTSLTSGSYNETASFSPTTGAVDVVAAGWFSDNDWRWLTYFVQAEYGSLFAVNRLAHNSVRDVEIGGLDGYVSVNDFYLSGQRIIELAVTDGQRTLFVSASGHAEESYTEDEVIALVATLRPATDEEWAAMLLAGENGAGEIYVPTPLGTEG